MSLSKYNQYALYASTGASTGVHYAGYVKQIQKVNSFSYTDESSDQFLYEIGSKSPLGFDKPTPNRNSINFSHYISTVENLRYLGIVNDSQGLIMQPLVSGNPRRNYFLLEGTGREDIGLNSLSDAKTVYEFTDGIIKSFSMRAEVGSIPTIDISVECLDKKKRPYYISEQLSNPSVIEGRDATKYTLPSPSQSETLAITRPQDIKISYSTNPLYGLASGARIQSFDFEAGIEYVNSVGFGEKYPTETKATLPINYNLSINAYKNENVNYDLDRLNDIGRSLSIQLDNCGGSGLMFSFKDLKIASVNEALSTDGSVSVIKYQFLGQISDYGTSNTNTGVFAGGVGMSLLAQQYTNPSAMYSLRRLNSDYEGPLLRLVRESDVQQRDFYYEGIESDEIERWALSENRILFSENLLSSYYAKVRGTATATAVLSPVGDQGVRKFAENTESGAHHIYADFASTNNESVVVSAFVKPEERTKVSLSVLRRDNIYAGATFDLSGRTLLSVQSGYSGWIERLPNDWNKLYLSGTVGSGVTTSRFHLFLDNLSSQSYVGISGHGVYLWGVQVASSNRHYTSTVGTAMTPSQSVLVTTWYDQSNNGNHAIQTGLGSMPVIASGTNIVLNNGRKTIRFNGGQTLNCQSRILDVNQNDTSAFYVSSRNYGNPSYMVTEARVQSPYASAIILGGVSLANFIAWRNGTTVGGGLAASSQALSSYRQSGSTFVAYYGGNIIVTQNTTNNTDSTTLPTIIGGDGVGTPSYIGDIQELITYKRDLGSQAMSTINSSIKNFYLI
jgi:hypothetical protein